jgi:hypothetical protein
MLRHRRLLLALAGFLSAAAGARGASTRRLPDSERFRLEDRYRAGSYLAMGGLLVEAAAWLTHDRDLTLGLYGASAAMRYAGLPLMGVSAQALCRDAGPAPCSDRAWPFFAVAAAAEAGLAWELGAMEYDFRHGAPRSDLKLAAAYGSAGAATAAFLYSWYRFREVRARNAAGEDDPVSWWLAPSPEGGLASGLVLRLGLGD